MDYKKLVENEKSKKFAIHLLAAFYLSENIYVSSESGECCICKTKGIGIDTIHQYLPDLNTVTDSFINYCKINISDVSEEEKEKARQTLREQPGNVKYREALQKRLIASRISDKVICQKCHEDIRMHGDDQVLTGNSAITKLLFKVKKDALKI